MEQFRNLSGWTQVGLVLLLSSGLWMFDWWLALLQMFLGVLLWGILSSRLPGESRFAFFCEGHLRWMFLGSLVLLAVTRLFPFVLSSHPLGYDTGIYRFEIWQALQGQVSPGTGVFLALPVLSQALGAMGYSVDLILYGLLVSFSVLMGVSVFVFVRKEHGDLQAFFALFLLLFSIVQWKAFSMVLLKQVIALPVVFFCFHLLSKRSYWVVLTLLFLALLQPMDAFLVGLSIAFFVPFAWMKRKDQRGYFLALLFFGVLGMVVLFVLQPGFWDAAWHVFRTALTDVRQVDSSLRSGVFLSLDHFGYQASLLFVFGLLGFASTFFKKGMSVFHVYVLILLFWIAAQLFFYQRLLIQLDVSLIVFAAVSMADFVNRKSENLSTWMVSLFAIGIVTAFFISWVSYQPPLLVEEKAQIEHFCDNLPAEAVVAATDSSYAPWVRGFCLRQHVFGPGLFENQWSRGDWEVFWKGENLESLQQLLDEYPRPLYFYVGSDQPSVPFSPQLFEFLENGWWQVRASL